MSSKTWFITGASSGLGHEWAVAALERGDRVAAAARRLDAVEQLTERYGDAVLPIALDVRDRTAVFGALARAHEHLGRLDVVVNCAGAGHYGAVEELTEEEARGLMDTNFFGALWVTQAALPFLREHGGGHLLMVSSVGGVMAGSSLGIYHASKWALEALSESLSKEVADFGIKVTILEPTGYRTAAERAAGRSAPHPAYAHEHERRVERRAFVEAREGDPGATPAAVLKVVDAEEPPLRLLLGAGTLQIVSDVYESRLATWRDWADISTAAHGELPLQAEEV
jgi:NAD(P)-dependent dehydrogenase (short-subunit alcohol dehydrogenase family)